MIDFSSQMKNLLMNILKLLEILGFSRFFFFLNFQIPDFQVFFMPKLSNSGLFLVSRESGNLVYYFAKFVKPFTCKTFKAN